MNLTIRMFVTDLDETFLRTDKTVSKRTRDAVQNVRERGVKVAYATARGASADALAPTNWFDGLIRTNGAVAYADGMKVYERLTHTEPLRDLLVAGDARGLRMAAEIEGCHYANFDAKAAWPFIRKVIRADFSTLSVQADKVYAIVKTQADAVFLQAHIPPEHYLTISRDGLAQIMHEEATKAKAIAALCQRWGLNMSQVVSFGDDLNDVDMLTQCGWGVAMGNALDSVKAAADEVCGDNNSDGLAVWMEQNLL